MPRRQHFFESQPKKLESEQEEFPSLPGRRVCQESLPQEGKFGLTFGEGGQVKIVGAVGILKDFNILKVSTFNGVTSIVIVIEVTTGQFGSKLSLSVSHN